MVLDNNSFIDFRIKGSLEFSYSDNLLKSKKYDIRYKRLYLIESAYLKKQFNLFGQWLSLKTDNDYLDKVTSFYINSCSINKWMKVKTIKVIKF